MQKKADTTAKIMAKNPNGSFSEYTETNRIAADNNIDTIPSIKK